MGDMHDRKQNQSYQEDIIRHTVHETLTMLGFNLSNPTEVQADIAYLRKARKGSEQVAAMVKRTCVGAFCSGILWVLWEGIKAAAQAKTGG